MSEGLTQAGPRSTKDDRGRSAATEQDRQGADPSQVSRFFAEAAGAWTDRYRSRSSFRERLQAVSGVVIPLLKDLHEPVVLDFGGGTGVFSTLSSAHARLVVNLDASEHMLRAGLASEAEIVSLVEGFAAPRPERIVRVVGSATTLSSQSGSVDLVLAIAVLEYLDEPRAALAAFSNLISPDGAIIITVPDDKSWFRRVESWVAPAIHVLDRTYHSERLRDRTYTSLRPTRNQTEWLRNLDLLGLHVARAERVALGNRGLLSYAAPNTLLVLKKMGTDRTAA